MTVERSPFSENVDFRRVFEDAPDAYLLVAPDPPRFPIQAASDVFLRMTGASRPEIVGQPIFEAFPELPEEGSVQGIDEIRQKLIEVVDSGGPTSIGTFRYDVPYGESDEWAERYWSPQNVPISDEHGDLLHILLRVDEVTDLILQRRHKQSDRQREQRVLVVEAETSQRNYLRRLLGAHWEVDVAVDTTEARAVFERRRPDAVVIAAELPDVSGIGFVARLKDEFGAELPVILRADEAGPTTYRRAFEAGADDVIGSQASAREFVSRTQSQLSEAHLREVLEERSQQQYRRLFMQAPVAIALLEGPEHVFTLSNPTYEELTGNRQLIGLEVREAFPEPGLQTVFDRLDDVYETGEPYVARERPVQFDDPEGERLRYLTFAYLPFRDLSGEIDGITVFAYDITEQVRMRKRAEQLADEARRESERKDEFLAMLGHELRNPLTPIVHAASLLEQSDDAETVEWASDVIGRQAEQLTRLVDDLLDVSRINQGRIEIEPTECRLDEIISAAIETVRVRIDEKQQELSRSLPSSDVWVRVDRERMVQVVANLLDNAAKYTPEGGHIWLEAEVDGRDLLLEVRDEGQGIDEEMLDEIFDLFAQSKSDMDSPGEGLGVGLALVRSLVQLHDGSVQAFSEGPDQGSRFVVELPVVVSDAEGTSDVTEPEPLTGAPPRVLVIEDNADVASSLDRLLSQMGAEVRLAENGRDGLETADEFGPDIILLDIGLPDLDGFEVARQLEGTDIRDDVTLVAVTGFGDEANVDRARDAGFDEFITKPASLEELRELLEAAQ